ncbi:hypothetical protein pb186bvf_000319 [Paramecium bursaria]
MGHKISLPSSKGQIYIKTQRTSYYSNETIQGWVFLNVQETGFKAGVVQMRFVGRNIASHTFSSTQQGSGYLRQLNKKFLNSYIHLHEFGKSLPIIQIVFPFEICLNLYSSTLKIGSQLNETRIEFCIVAEIVNLHNKMDTQIKFKLPIQIHKALAPIPKPINTIFKEDQQCCCFVKNLCSIIKLKIAKNEFQQGETIILEVDIDQSNCTKDLFVAISLKRKLEVLFPDEFVDQLIVYQFEDLKCEGGQKKTVSLQIELSQQNLYSSTFSANIQLQYLLRLQLQPSGSVFEVPITIIKPEYFLTNQQIYNYSKQIQQSPEILFEKRAKLIVNQIHFMKQDQLQLLQKYYNKQIDANKQYENYNVENNFQPVLYDIEIPIFVKQEQPKPMAILIEEENIKINE